MARRQRQLQAWFRLNPMSISEAYEILGVGPKAKEEDVKRAQRRIVLESHPDRHANAPAEIQAEHALRTQLANAAATLLKAHLAQGGGAPSRTGSSSTRKPSPPRGDSSAPPDDDDLRREWARWAQGGADPRRRETPEERRRREAMQRAAEDPYTKTSEWHALMCSFAAVRRLGELDPYFWRDMLGNEMAFLHVGRRWREQAFRVLFSGAVDPLEVPGLYVRWCVAKARRYLGLLDSPMNTFLEMADATYGAFPNTPFEKWIRDAGQRLRNVQQKYRGRTVYLADFRAAFADAKQDLDHLVRRDERYGWYQLVVESLSEESYKEWEDQAIRALGDAGAEVMCGASPVFRAAYGGEPQQNTASTPQPGHTVTLNHPVYGLCQYHITGFRGSTYLGVLRRPGAKDKSTPLAKVAVLQWMV